MSWCIHQASNSEAVESHVSLMPRSERDTEEDINNDQREHDQADGFDRQVKTTISKLFFNIKFGMPNQCVGAFTRQAIRRQLSPLCPWCPGVRATPRTI
jgi:hypothetical protein